jgi:integrase
VRRALKQARKTAPRRSRPPPPSPARLRAMAARCPRDLAGLRDRALLLLLAAGLSRRALAGLQAERLRWGADGVGLDGTVTVPRGARHDLCPLRALEDWLRASATSYGPVFRKVTRWGTVEPNGLGADAIRLILARRFC